MRANKNQLGRHQLTTPSSKVNKISCSYSAIANEIDSGYLMHNTKKLTIIDCQIIMYTQLVLQQEQPS